MAAIMEQDTSDTSRKGEETEKLALKLDDLFAHYLNILDQLSCLRYVF
jgi:hypothetical protein